MINSGFIKGIQNEMRKDDGVDGDAQRLSQLVWLIFLKVLDDDERQKEFLDNTYTPAVPEKYRWKTWAGHDDGITGDALLQFVNNDLFPGLKNLEIDPSNRRTTVVKEVFANSFNYMKNGTQLRKVINKINTIDFNSSEDRHSFGDIYETLLSSLQSAGNAGEFYTPRAITNFIVEQVNPRLGEKVFDPAAGTGGFLTGAIDRMRKDVKTPEDEQLLQNSIIGIEKKQLPYTLLVTNMIFHGIEEPAGIRHDNTLARPLISYGPEDFVDVIVANPPFGGSEEDGIEDNYPSAFRTRETADLFLVLFVRLLKSGGRAGIVLPDGTLFGEGIKTRIKQHLLEECNLHTIVRLPGSVFAPYTSIATNLLFFTKGEPTKEIWYYEHKLPDGVKAYNKTKPIRLEEFAPIKEWWNNREESEVSWKVGIDQIIDNNYNLDVKNPNAVVADELNPEEVLNAFRSKWSNIDKVADKLQESLQETLDNHSNQNVRFLTENLHEYLRVPNAISLLRKNILHLAVSGQLVPQIEREGNGEELYKKIQTEKADLARTGRAVKQKPLKEIVQSEVPFEIPASWKWARIGGVSVYSQRGKSPKYTDESDFPVISQKCVRTSRIDWSVIKFITPESVAKYENFRFLRDGDLLLNSTGTGTMGRVGIFRSNDDYEKVVADSHVTVVRMPDSVSAEFVHLWLNAPHIQDDVESKASGSTNQIEWNLSSIQNEFIPLPPEAEQLRIVQKTSELLNLLDEVDEHLRG